MKITTLLETNTTPSSDPAGQQSQQAPKFGRDPNVLEDEQLDEMTAGATGSGSVATGEPTNMGVQRRGKGSMLQGIKTSKKFPNSAAVKEGVEQRQQNALWAQITDYEKRAKATKNDIKKAHYMKMASELRSKLKTNDEQDVAEASPEATFNVLKGLKSWQVVIMNNYYRGKYSDYSGRYYYVLASSPEEAKQVVLDNADAILQDLLSMKSVNGKKILPRGSAVRITADRIGEIKDGTEAGRMTTMGYKKMFGPQGPMMVKLANGAIADVQGQKGVAEGTNNLSYIGNCTDDDVIEHIFGDATNFAQAVEEHGDEFTVNDLVVKYDPDSDIHSFYYKKQGVAEGYIFKGGFPFDVDHMLGSVIRNRDETTDVIKTKNKDKWDDEVDRINDEVFDDMADFTTDRHGETVTGNSAVWAKWDNAMQTGWINRKGNPLKPWPVKEQGVEEGYDKWGWHTSVTNGEFMPTKYGNKAYVYLHDLDNESPRGGPQLVTVNKPTVAKRIAKQFGGKVVKTDLNTYRVVKPAEQGVTEAEKYPEPEQEVIDATRRARLQREREPQGSEKIDAMLAQRNAQLQQYNETGKFWLKKKDTQEHISDAYVGKAAANQAALQLLKQHPELKGNIVITAWGPGETPVNEAELSEEQLLARDLKKQLELFKQAVDHDLGTKPNDKELGKKPKDKEVQKKK